MFFDWDRYNLSQQAESTISQAADAFKQTGSARVIATGHADRSGPENYNMAPVAAPRQRGQGRARSQRRAGWRDPSHRQG